MNKLPQGFLEMKNATAVFFSDDENVNLGKPNTKFAHARIE